MLREPDFSEVVAGLVLVGEHPERAGEIAEVLGFYRAQGVGGVISVCERPLDPAALLAHHLAGLHLPVADQGAPSPAQLAQGVAFIGQCGARGKLALVHCWAGIGRSATVACAYLVGNGKGPDEAIAQIRRLRNPMCVESQTQRAALHAFARTHGFS